MNRGFRNSPNTGSSDEQQPRTTAVSSPEKKLKKSSTFSLSKIGGLGLLVALAVVSAAAIFALVMFDGNNTSNSEAASVDTTKYQAVFLNGGQVYFGNISELNNKYIKLGKIFYLRVNQQVQPNSQSSTNNDVSLVKLGCELHGPEDQMVINRDQVIFWENIKDDGQVVKAINEYKKQYPDGEDCSKQASNTSTTTDTTANTSTTNKSTTTTKPTTTR